MTTSDIVIGFSNELLRRMATSSSPVHESLTRKSARFSTLSEPASSDVREHAESEPDEFDFLSLLTMTVALFGLGAFSLASLLGIIVG